MLTAVALHLFDKRLALTHVHCVVLIVGDDEDVVAPQGVVALLHIAVEFIHHLLGLRRRCNRDTPDCDFAVVGGDAQTTVVGKVGDDIIGVER